MNFSCCPRDTISLSPYLFDVVGLPCLVEERVQRAVETEEREPAFARDRLDPVLLFARGLWN